MFHYLFLCLRPLFCLVSFLLNAFAIGLQVLPLLFNPAPAVALQLLFTSAFPLFTGLSTFVYNAVQSVAGRFNFDFLFTFSPTRSPLCVV